MTTLYCAHCHVEFEKLNKRGLTPTYCSGRCRQAAYRARHGGIDERHRALGEYVDYIWRWPHSKQVHAFIESLYRETGLGAP